MSYKALGRYSCDGCKVVESDAIELQSDQLGPLPPQRWLLVTTSKLHGELHVIEGKHFCPMCAPLIESYLAGRRVPTDGGHA